MKKINRIHKICLFLLMVGTATSCDEGFEEVNKNVDLVTESNIDYVLPYVQLSMLDQTYYTIVDYVGSFVFQVNRRRDYERLIRPGGEHGSHFEWMYEMPLKGVADLMESTKDDPELVNYLSMTRIIRAYIMHQLTDVYGAVPYFEANKGYTERIFTPKYDPQEVIYMDMFKELEEAILAFDNSKAIPSSDIVYGGDLDKWKKFGYSFMLRLGLRIMDVDPVNGKKWVDKAIAGGLITSNDDNFVVYYLPNSDDSDESNPTANGPCKVFIKYDTYYLTEPFVGFLRDNNDPRTSVFCELRGNGDTTPENQLGYPPLGYISVPDKGIYSKSNTTTVARYDAPYIHLSYAQTQFQLAELVVRGIISGDDQAYYEAGVRAAMEQLAIFGPDAIISSGQIDTYLAENPYNPTTTEEALEMINTQYWVETHWNWYETFANMRRSNYPELYSKIDPSIEGNDGAELPGRLTYPSDELSINPQVSASNEIQGPDVCSTKLWWDVD
ncbi:MAG: SusD/RagB family nutrient-binding outer membrane lipoprotein [Bacteroidota bacterium]